MRDNSKTLPEGRLEPTAAQGPGIEAGQRFRSTFRTGTVPPPDDQRTDTSGLRRLEVQPLDAAKNPGLSSNVPRAPQTLPSLSPPTSAGQAGQAGTEQAGAANPGQASTLDLGALRGQGADGTQPRLSRPPDTLGRTLLGVPQKQPSRRGPVVRGDVKAARVQAIGAPTDEVTTSTADAFEGRITRRDPHRPESVIAEPVAEPAPGARVVPDLKASAPGTTSPLRESRVSSPAAERPSLIMAARNRLQNKVLVGAVLLAVLAIAGNELGASLPGSVSENVQAPEVTPEPVGRLAETPAIGVSASPGAVPDAPAGPMTKLDSIPSGAEVVHRGAVIANTPVALPRADSKNDYLLRKSGYHPQLVRINAESPRQITLELKPTAP